MIRANTYTMSISNPSGEVIMPSKKSDLPTIKENEDGSVTVKYQPHETGLHEMLIKYNGVHVNGMDCSIIPQSFLRVIHNVCNPELWMIIMIQSVKSAWFSQAIGLVTCFVVKLSHQPNWIQTNVYQLRGGPNLLAWLKQELWSWIRRQNSTVGYTFICEERWNVGLTQ